MKAIRGIAHALLLLAVTNAPSAQEDFPVPPGYRVYVLEPVDGRIAVPNDWTATNGSHPSGFVWRFMKDPQTDGSYGTGMALELFIGVRKRTGMSPAMLAFDAIDTLKKRGMVLAECPREEQEHFYKHCLEVLEEREFRGSPTKMHILYSIMPAKTFDMLVVTTYGAPDSGWAEQAPVIGVMSKVRIIGSGLKR